MNNNCKNCGSPLVPGAPFCGNCGTPINQNNVMNATPVQNVQRAPVQNVPVQPMGVPVQSVPVQNIMPPKKNNNLLLIIIVIVILILAGGGYYVSQNVLDKDNNESNSSEKKVSNKDKSSDKDEDDKDDDKDDRDDKDDDDEEDAVDLDGSKVTLKGENELGNEFELVDAFYAKSYLGFLNVLIKNTSDKNADITIYLNYYDENGKRVDRTLDSAYVEAGKVIAVQLTNRTKEKFVKYDVSIDAKEYKSYFHKIDVSDSELQIEEVDSNIRITYKNNSDHDFMAHGTVIYYKNDKIAYFDDVYLSGKPGETVEGKSYLSSYSEFDYKNPKVSDYFDKYEFILSSAYYWDSDY